MPFLTVSTDFDSVAEDWERVRIHFASDSRTLGELEALTGKQWMARYRNEEAQHLATRRWGELKGPGGRRYKNLRDLVELFSAAEKVDESIQTRDSSVD